MKLSPNVYNVLFKLGEPDTEHKTLDKIENVTLDLFINF